MNENKGKSKKYINFSWQFIFFSQNCLNYPVFSVSWRINILSKKDHQKKGIYAISRKKFLFTENVNFLMIFSLFHCFHQIINKKHRIMPQYTFFLKKVINDVFFIGFRSINGILNKTPFTSIIYAIWIEKKVLPKKWLFQSFFSYIHLLVEENQKNTFFISTILFFCKIAQITYKWLFFQCFRRFTTFKRKPTLLRKKYDFTPKVSFLIIFNWFQCFD